MPAAKRPREESLTNAKLRINQLPDDVHGLAYEHMRGSNKGRLRKTSTYFHNDPNLRARLLKDMQKSATRIQAHVRARQQMVHGRGLWSDYHLPVRKLLDAYSRPSMSPYPRLKWDPAPRRRDAFDRMEGNYPHEIGAWLHEFGYNNYNGRELPISTLPPYQRFKLESKVSRARSNAASSRLARDRRRQRESATVEPRG